MITISKGLELLVLLKTIKHYVIYKSFIYIISISIIIIIISIIISIIVMPRGRFAKLSRVFNGFLEMITFTTNTSIAAGTTITNKVLANKVTCVYIYIYIYHPPKKDIYIYICIYHGCTNLPEAIPTRTL